MAGSPVVLKPRRIPNSVVDTGHQDFVLLSEVAEDIIARAPDLRDGFVNVVLNALEFVLDPVRTGRTRLADLDKVEKTFVGLKVEHFLREYLRCDTGVRDLVLAKHNVDVKNTVGTSWSWEIPPETYSESGICLLSALDDGRRVGWLGLIVARPEYLRPGSNRDAKRGIAANAYQHILWLVRGSPIPPDRWAQINMDRFRELRKQSGGTLRAAMFFRENLRRPIHRHIVQALLHDQHDYMKRLRANGGAKDLLQREKIALLSGAFFNPVLEELGLGRIGSDEHIAVDAQNYQEEQILRLAGEL